MTRGLRLLIVDDEKIEREAVRYFASSLPYTISAIAEAENGIEAVCAAREFRPDIIILDIRMPGASGMEAAQSIRKEDARARIIFLTAFGELEYAKAAFKVRADDFLVKPVAEASFREAMARAVSSLKDAGALRPLDEGHGEIGSRAAETFLIDSIRQGDDQAAVRAAERLFEAIQPADCGLQVVRRNVRLSLSFIDRRLREEFSREMDAERAAMESVSSARDRAECRDCLLAAAAAYAREIATIKEHPHRKKIEEALAFVESKWPQAVSLELLSAHVDLSSSHFSRLFHSVVGLAYSEYVAAKRIARAKELLRDQSLPIKRVCDMSGFADQAYFSSQFKKREGISPSEFRAMSGCRQNTRPLLTSIGAQKKA